MGDGFEVDDALYGLASGLTGLQRRVELARAEERARIVTARSAALAQGLVERAGPAAGVAEVESALLISKPTAGAIKASPPSAACAAPPGSPPPPPTAEPPRSAAVHASSPSRLTQDDLPWISISPLRAQGAVTESMGSVRVAIAGLEREVRLSHRRFPNGGGWSFFVCPECGRRARVLKLNERIACWRCTRSGSPPRRLLYRVEQKDRAGRIERLTALLYGGQVARLKPRPGRTLDRRARTELALRRALIAERSGLKRFDADA